VAETYYFTTYDSLHYRLNITHLLTNHYWSSFSTEMIHQLTSFTGKICSRADKHYLRCHLQKITKDYW